MATSQITVVVPMKIPRAASAERIFWSIKLLRPSRNVCRKEASIYGDLGLLGSEFDEGSLLSFCWTSIANSWASSM